MIGEVYNKAGNTRRTYKSTTYRIDSTAVPYGEHEYLCSTVQYRSIPLVTQTALGSSGRPFTPSCCRHTVCRGVAVFCGGIGPTGMGGVYAVDTAASSFLITTMCTAIQSLRALIIVANIVPELTADTWMLFVQLQSCLGPTLTNQNAFFFTSA